MQISDLTRNLAIQLLAADNLKNLDDQTKSIERARAHRDFVIGMLSLLVSPEALGANTNNWVDEDNVHIPGDAAVASAIDGVIISLNVANALIQAIDNNTVDDLTRERAAEWLDDYQIVHACINQSSLASFVNTCNGLFKTLGAELTMLRAFKAVHGGEFCREARAKGNNPCGACSICVAEQTQRAELVEHALNELGRENARLLKQLLNPVDELVDRQRRTACLLSADGDHHFDPERIGGGCTVCGTPAAMIAAERNNPQR